MKLVTFDNGRIGVVSDGRLVDVSDLAAVVPGAWPPVGMVRFIAEFPALRPALADALRTRTSVALEEVRLEAPVQWPNKVIAFPANYHAHIEEMKHGAGSGVISTYKASGQGFFLKANSSLSGPADGIVLPPLDGREIHHECELGIIVGKRGRGIAREDFRDYVFGFTCLLDMVVRGKEERVMRKSYDTFCPTGPWITTADEIEDFDDIGMTLLVNGEERQSAVTRDLIVDIAGHARDGFRRDDAGTGRHHRDRHASGRRAGERGRRARDRHRRGGFDEAARDARNDRRSPGLERRQGEPRRLAPVNRPHPGTTHSKPHRRR